MKKMLAMFLFISILTLTLSNSFGQTFVSLKDIKYVKNGSQDKITLYSANYKGFKAFYLANPDRLVIDIPNNIVTVQGSSTIKINSSMIKSARFSQFTKSTARVVIDLKGKQQYTIEQKNGSLSFVFGKAASSPAKTVVKTETKPKEPSRGDVERPPVAANQISYTMVNNIDKIVIPGGNHKGYNIVKMENPDRIIAEIPNCTVPEGQKIIPGKMASVKSIQYTQLMDNTARIVIETIGQQQYRITDQPDQLILFIESSAYKNVAYTAHGETATLILKGTRLEEIIPGESSDGGVNNTDAEAAAYKPLYSEITDPAGKNYSISFPAILADLGSGILQINDDILDSIEISNNIAGQTTQISFKSKYSCIFDVTYNPNTNDTEINILKPFTKTDKLVVLDPGHGGSDPGACYAGIMEKDLNLKIALMVDEILKGKGIKTYMTRNDDTFVPLYDRTNLANDLNASLFLSIHNNAFNKSEHGTETLCYPSDKSRQFASIVQRNLVNALGTKDKGIINRPNLVVLHSSKMPAALAEIAYLTNDGDRKKLLDEKFLENAAEALAASIIEALNTIK